MLASCTVNICIILAVRAHSRARAARRVAADFYLIIDS